MSKGCLQHTVQKAKSRATRHPIWGLKAEEHHHGNWGEMIPEQSPPEQGMMGTWKGSHSGHITEANIATTKMSVVKLLSYWQLNIITRRQRTMWTLWPLDLLHLLARCLTESHGDVHCYHISIYKRILQMETWWNIKGHWITIKVLLCFCNTVRKQFWCSQTWFPWKQMN